MAIFFSYNALLGQRAAGYKNTAYALAELIDNSFDADAKHVQIALLEKRVDGRRKVEEIIVCDDGIGMSADVLQGALQFGNTTNDDLDVVVRTKKKGKFGYGLPNASLSQCPSIHVYSWKKSDAVNYVYLDLDELKTQQSIEIPAVSQSQMPVYYEGIFNGLPATGTIVSWRKCDRLSYVKGESIALNSMELLGRLYRYLLAEGKKISFVIYEYNEKTRNYVSQRKIDVRPNDPLFLMDNTVISKHLWSEAHGPEASGKKAEIYAKYVSSPEECSPTSAALEDFCYTIPYRWKGHSYNFDIKTSVVLPEIQKPGQRDGGSTDVGDFYGRKEREGNISFVRADREITSGHFGTFYNRTLLPNRFWSVEIRFDADADDLLGVHNNKQGIEFTKTDKEPDEDEFNEHTADLLQARANCWLLLTNKIASAIKEAEKLVKKQSSEWDSTHITIGGTKDTPQLPTSTTGTADTIKIVDGQRPKKLPTQELQRLEARLIDKYPNIDADDIKRAIGDLDKSLTRACVLYAPAEAKQLWSYTKVFDFVVVLVNTNHEFYRRILSELRIAGAETALTAIELFLSSLALEEEDFVAIDSQKEIIEAFREAVGSKLHRYMTNLPEAMQIFNENATIA